MTTMRERIAKEIFDKILDVIDDGREPADICFEAADAVLAELDIDSIKAAARAEAMEEAAKMAEKYAPFRGYSIEKNSDYGWATARERIAETLRSLAKRAEALEESDAVKDVKAERRRQIESEGWTPDHDDEHAYGEMASAGACYALNGAQHWAAKMAAAQFWPWSKDWWKPTTRRCDLVKAGALILAEIERLDRAALAKATE